MAANKNNKLNKEMDDFFNSLLKSALMEFQYPEKTKSLISRSDADRAAEATKKMFDAYLRAGFSEEQAIGLIGAMVSGNKQN